MSTSRRTVLTAAAWTAPAIAVAATAPAYATSNPVRKDPGINGWMQVTYGTTRGFDALFDSDPNGTDPATPDANPFGLYVYDVNIEDGRIVDTIAGASIVLWFRARVSSWAYGPGNNNANGGGHGRGWSRPSYEGAQVKPDGTTYHGYRFDYTGPYVIHSDGRVWLQDVEVTARNVPHDDATFWVERRIVVNGEMQAFQRRNGERGPLGDGFPSARARTATVGTDGLI